MLDQDQSYLLQSYNQNQSLFGNMKQQSGNNVQSIPIGTQSGAQGSNGNVQGNTNVRGNNAVNLGTNLQFNKSTVLAPFLNPGSSIANINNIGISYTNQVSKIFTFCDTIENYTSISQLQGSTQSHLLSLPSNHNRNSQINSNSNMNSKISSNENKSENINNVCINKAKSMNNNSSNGGSCSNTNTIKGISINRAKSNNFKQWSSNPTQFESPIKQINPQQLTLTTQNPKKTNLSKMTANNNPSNYNSLQSSKPANNHISLQIQNKDKDKASGLNSQYTDVRVYSNNYRTQGQQDRDSSADYDHQPVPKGKNIQTLDLDNKKTLSKTPTTIIKTSRINNNLRKSIERNDSLQELKNYNNDRNKKWVQNGNMNQNNSNTNKKSMFVPIPGKNMHTQPNSISCSMEADSFKANYTRDKSRQQDKIKVNKNGISYSTSNKQQVSTGKAKNTKKHENTHKLLSVGVNHNNNEAQASNQTKIERQLQLLNKKIKNKNYYINIADMGSHNTDSSQAEANSYDDSHSIHKHTQKRHNYTTKQQQSSIVMLPQPQQQQLYTTSYNPTPKPPPKTKPTHYNHNNIDQPSLSIYLQQYHSKNNIGSNTNINKHEGYCPQSEDTLLIASKQNCYQAEQLGYAYRYGNNYDYVNSNTTTNKFIPPSTSNQLNINNNITENSPSADTLALPAKVKEFNLDHYLYSNSYDRLEGGEGENRQQQVGVGQQIDIRDRDREWGHKGGTQDNSIFNLRQHTQQQFPEYLLPQTSTTINNLTQTLTQIFTSHKTLTNKLLQYESMVEQLESLVERQGLCIKLYDRLFGDVCGRLERLGGGVELGVEGIEGMEGMGGLREVVDRVKVEICGVVGSCVSKLGEYREQSHKIITCNSKANLIEEYTNYIKIPSAANKKQQKNKAVNNIRKSLRKQQYENQNKNMNIPNINSQQEDETDKNRDKNNSRNKNIKNTLNKNNTKSVPILQCRSGSLRSSVERGRGKENGDGDGCQYQIKRQANDIVKANRIQLGSINQKIRHKDVQANKKANGNILIRQYLNSQQVDPGTKNKFKSKPKEDSNNINNLKTIYDYMNVNDICRQNEQDDQYCRMRQQQEQQQLIASQIDPNPSQQPPPRNTPTPNFPQPAPNGQTYRQLTNFRIKQLQTKNNSLQNELNTSYMKLMVINNENKELKEIVEGMIGEMNRLGIYGQGRGQG